MKTIKDLFEIVEIGDKVYYKYDHMEEESYVIINEDLKDIILNTLLPLIGESDYINSIQSIHRPIGETINSFPVSNIYHTIWEKEN